MHAASYKATLPRCYGFVAAIALLIWSKLCFGRTSLRSKNSMPILMPGSWCCTRKCQTNASQATIASMMAPTASLATVPQMRPTNAP